jgi:hypothetical protein
LVSDGREESLTQRRRGRRAGAEKRNPRAQPGMAVPPGEEIPKRAA